MRVLLLFAVLVAPLAADELEDARDRQDRAALERMIPGVSKAAEKSPNDAGAHYRLALAESYLSEVALELKDKELAKSAAEAGIKAAERAVALDARAAEHHRILGTLCGQVIPAHVLSALRYGRCATDSVNKAIELDPKSSDAYLSRAVGRYYLPPAFGGGPEPAVEDCRRAIQLNPKSAGAYLWLGIALRKLNRNSEAREAIAQSLQLNPRRVWARQQLEKTPK